MGQVLPEVEVQSALMAACREEGMEGLTDFYRTYAPAVRALCLARLGDRALAEDACHDTILKAYQAANRFWPGAQVWPWLSTIAHNICTDVQRRQRREVFAGLAPDGQSHVGEPSADDEAQARIHSDLVAEALRSLPARQRELLYRYEYQGYSYQDIAELTGTSLPAVRTALMRARQALRAKVEELNTDQPLWPLSVASLGRLPRRLRAWRVRVAGRIRHAALTKPDLAGHLAAVTALTVVAATGIGLAGAQPSGGSKRVVTAPAAAPLVQPPTGDVAAPASSAPVPPAGTPPSTGGGSGGGGRSPGPPSGGGFHFRGPAISTSTGNSSNSPNSINVGTIGVNCDQVTQAQGLGRVVCPTATNPPLLPPLAHQ